MLPTVRIVHLLSFTLWGGGLVLISALLWRRPDLGGALRRGRQWVLGPAAYLTILTGIWLLHSEPALLKARFMYLKILGLLAVMVLDYALARATEANAQGTPLDRGRMLLLHGCLTVSVGAVALVSQVKPWA